MNISGGGFIGFAGYPIGGFGLSSILLLFLFPLLQFLLGLSFGLGQGLGNLGLIIFQGNFGNYGYGFGNNYCKSSSFFL
jgi:hypothetical protein